MKGVGTSNVCTLNEVLIAKLPPAPPRQAQKRIRLGIDGTDLAVRGHDLSPHQLIAGETVSAHVEADAAAEKEPADAHGRATAVRDGDADLLQRRVERAVEHPASNGRDLGVRIEIHPVKQPEVDHQPRRRRVAGVVVPPAPGHEGHLVLAGPENTLSDVVRTRATRDARGKRGVEDEVVRRDDPRPARRSGPQQLTGQTPGQIAPRGGRDVGDEGLKLGPRPARAGDSRASHERQLCRPDQEPTPRDGLVHDRLLRGRV